MPRDFFKKMIRTQRWETNCLRLGFLFFSWRRRHLHPRSRLEKKIRKVWEIRFAYVYSRREEDLKQGRRPPFSQIQKRGMYSRQLRSHFMASLDGDWEGKKRKRAFVPLVERAVGSMSR